MTRLLVMWWRETGGDAGNQIGYDVVDGMYGFSTVFYDITVRTNERSVKWLWIYRVIDLPRLHDVSFVLLIYNCFIHGGVCRIRSIGLCVGSSVIRVCS